MDLPLPAHHSPKLPEALTRPNIIEIAERASITMTDPKVMDSIVENVAVGQEGYDLLRRNLDEYIKLSLDRTQPLPAEAYRWTEIDGYKGYTQSISPKQSIFVGTGSGKVLVKMGESIEESGTKGNGEKMSVLLEYDNDDKAVTVTTSAGRFTTTHTLHPFEYEYVRTSSLATASRRLTLASSQSNQQ